MRIGSLDLLSEEMNCLDSGIIFRHNVCQKYMILDSCTVMILSFRTDMPGQTVQTKIRLLQEQSDQGLHCLPFRLHYLDSLLYGRAT